MAIDNTRTLNLLTATGLLQQGLFSNFERCRLMTRSRCPASPAAAASPARRPSYRAIHARCLWIQVRSFVTKYREWISAARRFLFGEVHSRGGMAVPASAARMGLPHSAGVGTRLANDILLRETARPDHDLWRECVRKPRG